MEYLEICKGDRDAFHALANRYYREGEDENTPQEQIDFFIDLLFDKICTGEIKGCFSKVDGAVIGFALWAMDSEGFDFSEMPGLGTILEIGLIPAYRSAGRGREFVAAVEETLRREGAAECYITAYGPARGFWEHCGYKTNGRIGRNCLPILVKTVGEAKGKSIL